MTRLQQNVASSTDQAYKTSTLYLSSGVPEYWVVDPDARNIIDIKQLFDEALG